MNYRTLGRTGLKVSEIGFGGGVTGTKIWGSDFNDADSLNTLKRAYDLGINFFDTSDSYGNGHSEELFGEALKSVRNKVIIATKFGVNFYPLLEKMKDGRQPGLGPGDMQEDFSPGYTRFAIEQSLKRLKTDYIDLIQFHSPKNMIAEYLDAMEVLLRLKEEGKVRYIGVSVRGKDLGINQALECLSMDNIDTVQFGYSMIDLHPEEKVLPDAKAANKGVLARAVLHYGLLSDKYKNDTQFADDDHRRMRFTKDREMWNKMIDYVTSLRFLVGEGKAETMIEAAVRYPLSNPVVSTVLVGCKRPSQIEDHVRASSKGPLDIEEIEQVKKLWKDFLSNL